MKRSVKYRCCAVIAVAAALLAVFVAGTPEPHVLESEVEAEKPEPSVLENEVEADVDCLPVHICWDGENYYWTGEKVYEDLLCPDVAGTILSVVSLGEPVTENGQTNIQELREGDTVRQTAYGDAIAVCVEDEWMWLERWGMLGPEEIFYIPKNEWRPFLKEGAEECAGVTLTAEQAAVDAESFEGAPHLALVLKNDSDHAVSYCRGAVYVLKEIDGQWCFWFGQTDPGDAQENPYVIAPSQKERFLAPLATAFPKTERDAGTYRVGLYVDCGSGEGKTARAFIYTELTIR